MHHLFVDFGRGTGDEVPLLLTSSANAGITVVEGEHIVLYDGELEVEGVAHQGVNALGRPYWFALPDWATQRDTEVPTVSFTTP